MISLDWKNLNEITICKGKCYKLITSIWSIIRNKWSDLLNSDLEKRRIIQGAIGYSSFNKVIVGVFESRLFKDEIDFINEFEERIKYIFIESDKWLLGNYYSEYSSESGYNIVA